MLANFLEKSKPITFVMLGVLFFCILFFTLITGNSVSFYLENSLFSYVSYLIILLLHFLIFNFIITKNQLTFDNTYAFFFLIICFGVFQTSFLNEKILFINLILLLFFRKVYSLKTQKKVIQKLFDSGFWLGVVFIIAPFNLLFAFLLFGAIYIHQKTIIQTLLVPIVGFVVPVILYFTYCFWFNKLPLFYELFYWETIYDFSVYKQIKFVIPLIVLGIFLLISIVLKTPNTLSVNNTFRRNWILILVHLTISIILVVLQENKNGSELVFFFFPVAVILANGLELVVKPFYKNSLIVLFLSLVVTLYFLN